MNVEIPLRTARRLLRTARAGHRLDSPLVVQVAKAVARAEALLTPRPWKKVFGVWWDRSWPRQDVVAARVDEYGWRAFPRNPSSKDGDPVPLASGPETGAEGQCLADQALAAYCKRQGLTLPASWFLR